MPGQQLILESAGKSEAAPKCAPVQIDLGCFHFRPVYGSLWAHTTAEWFSSLPITNGQSSWWHLLETVAKDERHSK